MGSASHPAADVIKAVDLSVISPAHNEQDNVRPLVDEIRAALDATNIRYEIIVIDDASSDATLDGLRDLAHEHPDVLRVLALSPSSSGGGNGQSAAFRVGIRAARGAMIAMLDADLQNDPADIPRLYDLLITTDADMAQGDRSHARRDSLVRRVTSLVGRTARRLLIADTIRDTGCSMRVMRREVAMQLPLEFRGIHRFIPVTARQLGYEVIEVQVNHRPRIAGEAKYGIWNRALPGLIDCFAVRWMRSRRRSVTMQELRSSTAETDGDAAWTTEWKPAAEQPHLLVPSSEHSNAE